MITVVATIVVAITIFVAELSFKKDAIEYRTVVMCLGAFSHNIALILFIAIVIVFDIIFKNISLLSATIIPLFILIIFCFDVVLKIFRIIVNSDYFEKYQRFILKRNLELFYKKMINFREKNIDINKKSQKYKDFLQTGPMSDVGFDAIEIRANKSGIVTDINIEEIYKLLVICREDNLQIDIKHEAQKIYQEIQENNFDRKNKIQVLTGDKIEKNSSIIAYIDKRFENNEEEIRKTLYKCITIDSNEHYDAAFGLVDLQEGLQIDLLKQISNNNYIKMEKNLKRRLWLHEDFLKFLKSKDVGMGKNFSENEGWMIFSPDQLYRFIKWFSDDIHVAFNIIFSKRNILFDIVERFSQFIFNMLCYSVVYHNFYFFKKFIVFVPMFYGENVKNKRINRHLLDGSWRMLYRIGDGILFEQIEKEKDEKEEKRENLALLDEIMYTYQSLIVCAIELEKYEDIKMFFNKMNDFGKYKDFYLEERKTIKDYLDECRHEIYFGIAYFILRKESKINEKNIENIFAIVKSNIKELSIKEIFSAYKRIYDGNGRHRWHWDDWTLKPDSEFHSVDTHDYIDYILCGILLSKSNNLMCDDKSLDEIPLVNNILGHFGKNGSIYNKLKYVQDNFSRYFDVENVESVEKFLLCVHENQSEKVQKALETAECDKSKIQNFKDEFIKKYNEEKYMMNFLNEMNAFEDKCDVSRENAKRIGVSHIFGKEHFVKNWHVGFLGDGAYFADGFVNGESEEIMKKWSEISREISNFDEFLKYLDEMKNPIIITNNYYKSGMRTIDGFKSKWEEGNKKYDHVNFVGTCNGIDIFEFRSNIEECFLIILEKNNIGKFVQYSPIKSSDEKDKQLGKFYFNIQSLSGGQEVKNDILREKPRWLIEKGNKNAQEKYLNKKVLIEIYESFSFTVDHVRAYKFIVKEK